MDKPVGKGPIKGVGLRLTAAPHPLLHAAAFLTSFAAPLETVGGTAVLSPLLALDAPAPLQREEAVRAAVRDLLRHGGYKPTGRGKPASEYLVRAATNGRLGPINAAVDACNVVSLHSGLPISVVDLDRTAPPLHLALAAPEATYVFNTTGQEIRLGGLLCLHDAHGPCANAVKDSQRTKTHPGTRQTLSIVWGTTAYPGRTEQTTEWYRALLERLGATTLPLPIQPAPQ